MSELELKQLRLLMRIRSEVGRHARETNEQLEDFVAFLLNDGTSLRVIAEQLGVGPTTVRNWASNAVQRREPTAELE